MKRRGYAPIFLGKEIVLLAVAQGEKAQWFCFYFTVKQKNKLFLVNQSTIFVDI